MAERKLPSLKVGFFIGAGLGGLLATLLGGAGLVFLRTKAASDARRDWRLRPATVAARELAPGTKLTFDDLSMRSLPEMTVTRSVVVPDKASYLIHQTVRAPVIAGDPMWWVYMGQLAGNVDDYDLFDSCRLVLKASPRAPRPESSLSEIRTRLLRGAP